jgi:hypothetical protein
MLPESLHYERTLRMWIESTARGGQHVVRIDTALTSSQGSHRTCGLESVTYRFQVTGGAVNVSDAVADCPLLPAG